MTDYISCVILDLQGAWRALAVHPVLVTGVMAGLYLVGMLLVRRWVIALNNRTHLMAEINGARASLGTVAPMPGAGAAQHEEIRKLLDAAQTSGQTRSLVWGRLLAGWRLLHKASVLLAETSTKEQSVARMASLEAELRDWPQSPDAIAAADRIKKELPSLPNVTQPALIASVKDALRVLYEARDGYYEGLAEWDSKTVWLTIIGLALIVALVAYDQGLHASLLLFGAAGGFMSRLSRALHTQSATSDYGAYWTTLFLSPVAGALAGWLGCLLAVIAKDQKVLGEAFKQVAWDTATPTTVMLGLAIVLGFSERLFDTIVSSLEKPFAGKHKEAT